MAALFPGHLTSVTLCEFSTGPVPQCGALTLPNSEVTLLMVSFAVRKFYYDAAPSVAVRGDSLAAGVLFQKLLLTPIPGRASPGFPSEKHMVSLHEESSR